VSGGSGGPIAEESPVSHLFRIRVALAGAFLLPLVIVVAGCASSVPTASPATGTPKAATARPSVPVTAAPTDRPSAVASGSSVPSADAGAAVEVRLASGAIGSYLVGRGGRTLYTFLHDSPGGSTCNLECAVTWPPFVLGAGERITAGAGVMGPLGLVTRADGTKQVEYRGHPLYTYSGDAKAGATTGQGNGSAWSVARP
jgi:predicted lipoprotein with Yx(FWY)xxD motif